MNGGNELPGELLGGYLRIHLVRTHGKITFVEGYDYDEGGYRSIVLSYDRTKDYNQLRLRVHPGAILRAEVLIKDGDKDRYLLLRGAVVSQECTFPSQYPRVPIKDDETRISERPLVMISDPRLRDRLRNRSRALTRIRTFFRNQGFLQLEPPVLQSTFGGAVAAPFTTYANSIKKELYLRICHQFPLKKAVIGGFGRVYHIGSVFRNQDATSRHSPEYSLLQSYMVGPPEMDVLFRQMELITAHAWNEISGSWIFQGIDLREPWPRVHWKDLCCGNYSDENLKSIEKRIKKNNLDLPRLFHLVSPPERILPLAKSSQGFALAFQSYFEGLELSTAYVEECDHAELLRKWNLCEDKSQINQDFLRNLRMGCPPLLGLGIGMDRLFKVLLKEANIREVMYNPAL